MKKILCTILMILLLTPAVFAAGEDMTFRLSDGAGMVGDTITLIGAVENAPDTASFRVIMTYDTAVLEPVEGKKLDTKGMFTVNTKATYEGKPAVNALSVDAKQVLTGDMNLFSVTFRILSAPKNASETTVEVIYNEFFQPDLTRLHPTIVSSKIQISSGIETPDDELIDPDPSVSDGNDEPATGPDDKTPSDNAPSAGDSTNNNTVSAPPSDTSKPSNKPTGNWLVEDNTIYHVEENGETTTYRGEITKDEDGKVTHVDLYDEDNKPAGSLTVDGQAGSILNVTEQDLQPEPAPKSILPYLLIVLAVVIAGAAVAFVLIRRKKSEEPDVQ